MREIFMYGSVRGVARKGHSYRDRMKRGGSAFLILQPQSFILAVK